MLELANLRVGNTVLDVAAGTGDQTLMAARHVGPAGYVLVTDISTSMLNVAAEVVRNAGLTNVETRVMDAENIELDADSFDAVIMPDGSHVVCQSGQIPYRDAPRGEADREGCRPCMVN